MSIYLHDGKFLKNVENISMHHDARGLVYFIAIDKDGYCYKIYAHEIKEIKIEI